MKKTLIQRRNDAKLEFLEIVQTYIVPLLDIKGNCQLVDQLYYNKRFIQKVKDSNEILIFPLVPGKKNHLFPAKKFHRLFMLKLN